VTPAAPYPPAPKADDADLLHGIRVPDPFRALEDPADPATMAWTAAQDELLAAHRTRWPGRDALRTRLAELLAAGSVGTPVWRGERAFHTRRAAEQEHAVLLVVEPDGTERVLVDPHAVDPSGTTTLDAWQPSKEGDLLAYQLSEGGTEESVLRVMDVTTGAVVDGPIDRARYSPVAWIPGGDAYYYVRRLAPDAVPDGEQQYHRRVYLHRLGTDPATDVEVFGAGRDKTTYYGASVSRDGRWLVVTAARGTEPRTDVWLADLAGSDVATPELRVVQEGVDARASLHVARDGRLLVWTDRDAARGRLCVADPLRPAPEHWRDLLPEDPEAVLEDYAVLDGPELARPLLLVSWTRHAVSEVTVHDAGSGERVGSVDLPGLGTLGGLSERPEGGPEAWVVYTDETTPVRVLRYDARDGSLSTWAEAPGPVAVPEVHTCQVTYPSADGTSVRMLVVAPTAEPDRPRPTVLYGYGGFGISLTPAYSASVLAWVEAGGVWAVAGLRGGSEEGEAWHRAGMRERKQAVFDDFHAAAERLVADGWTDPDRLGISGGSNGGLLVGVALTQRPQAYRAVVCSAPLLDMVRYERSGLGATWHDEYGSAAVAEELGWLLSYSPYHHVHEGTAYPAVLFTVFESDTRVDPMHARKMCAALQAATAADPATHPVLLRVEREVGHGARAVSRTVDLSADQLAFLAAHLGLTPS
jgi:prolyl oligopeptidase